MTTVQDKKLLEESIVNFFSRKAEYRSLSNFWENEVQITDNEEIRIYESGEHCFHGEKYIQLSKIESIDENRKNILFNYGVKFIKPSIYKTCTEVKKMGGKKGLLLNKNELNNWINISCIVQKQICKWKVDNYEQVKNDLLKSGNKILIHPALRCSETKIEQTSIWEGKGVVRDGKIVILGKNKLGNIWMEIRKTLIK